MKKFLHLNWYYSPGIGGNARLSFILKKVSSSADLASSMSNTHVYVVAHNLQITATCSKHSFLITPFMTDSGSKGLCTCGCGRNVTQPIELQHQQGKGPLILASAILEQNLTLIGGHIKQKLSCQSVRQLLIVRRAPIHNSLGTASSGLAGSSSHGGVLDHFSDNDDDYPMNYINAGPSGVCDDTPMQYSPPPIPNFTST